jgi:hypothetical protein
MAAMRAVVEPNKGHMQGTAARAPFDALMSRVKAPLEVTFHEETLGGVSGWGADRSAHNRVGLSCTCTAVGSIGERLKRSATL